MIFTWKSCSLHLQLSDKERELKHLQNVTHQSQKESYQQEQLADRLRHYEAQAQLVETLQRELQSSQVQC